MTRPIRIAAQLHPQHGKFADLRRAAVEAEEMGYDIVYTWDHFFPLYGKKNGEHFECLTTLAAIAEATSRIEIGPLVLCNSYRSPSLVADMAHDRPHLGRAIHPGTAPLVRRDHDEYGYEFGTAYHAERWAERSRRCSIAPKSSIPTGEKDQLDSGTGETSRFVGREDADSGTPVSQIDQRS